MFTKFLDCFRQGPTVFKPSKVEDKQGSSLDEDSKTHLEVADASTDIQVDDDEEHPRCDWDTIDAIPASHYEALVSRTCTFSGPLKQAKCLAYKKGAFNAVSFVGVLTRGKIDTYVVRVPGHATIEHWTAQDAYMMQREVEVIEYIRENTSAPVPQVCAYSTNFNNILGHPFIMMTRLPGKSAYSIWFDDEYNEADPKTSFRYGDLPSPAVEKKRISFLRSLAKIMAEINTLPFGGIGMPIVPLDGSATPSIGPLQQWDNTGSDIPTERPVLISTQDYVRARPDSLQISATVTSGSKAQTYVLGARKLLDMIFAQSVFNPASPGSETFTLHHSDLDLQNILVDPLGNVTGIIDWDRCLAVPRCIGAASAPLFLQKDWMPAYLNNLSTSPYMAFTTHRYRQIYAAALAEQGSLDAKYTCKSAMYQAGVMALYERDYGDVDDFLEKVLRCIPEFRADVKEVIRAFGVGWPAGEYVMRKHLKEIFEPETPDSKILDEVDAEIAAMDWMMGLGYQIDIDR